MGSVLSLGDLSLNRQIDIGTFLTFITLVAGFGWWLYSTLKSWHDKGQEEARSGALRLLLKLLRDSPNQRIDLQLLYDKFQSDDNAEARRIYCRRSWKFKSYPNFEGAIYRLHYEGKIDFASPAEITFRTERRYARWKQYLPTEADGKAIVAILVGAMRNPDPVFGLSDIAEAAMHVDPAACTRILREHLNDADAKIRQRAAMLIGRLVPEA
jgi:hypothetical protein